MTPRHIRRALLFASTALAVGLTAPLAATALTGDAPDAQVAIWGMEVSGDGTPIVHVAPGRLIAVPFGVTYDADAVTPGPVSVGVTLPAGLQFVSADALVPEAPGVTARWVCDPQGQRVQCELRTADGAAGFPLDPDHGVHLTMRVKATDVPAVPKGGDPVPVGEITADVAVPDATGVLTGSAKASVVASDREAAPRLHVSHVNREPTGTTGRAAREGYDLFVHDVGHAPARTVGRRPAVVLRGVVPSIAVTGVTVDGDGWRCRVAGHYTCSYGRTLPQGSTAPPLRVRWAPRHDSPALDEAWVIGGVVGYATERGTAATLPFERETRLSLPSTVVQLGVHARVPGGLHVVGGHAPKEMHVTLQNNGSAYARAAGVQVHVPAGVAVTPVTPGWRCTGDAPMVRCSAPRPLAAQEAVRGVLALAAPRHVANDTGAVTVSPTGPKGIVRGEAHEFPIMVLDPGDPEVTPTVSFRRGGVWEQWRDGGVEQPGAGDAFAYRINLENTGGVAVMPGDRVTVRQRMGAAMGAVSVLGGPGIRCSGPGVSCTVDVAAPVAPGKPLGAITVTTHPMRIGAERALGAIATTVDGARDRERLDMNVQVVDNPDSLRPGIRVLRDPSAGGSGSLVMVVENTGGSAVHAVHAVGAIPAGLRATGVQAPTGWGCRVAAARVSCTYRGTVAPGARTPGVTIRVAATGTHAASLMVGVSADARAADGALQRGRRRGAMPVRGPIAASATATPRVVTAAGGAAGRRVALDGTSSTGNGAALDYSWSQRCLTPRDARAVPQCRGAVTPAAVIADPHMASTSVVLPEVGSRTAFVFSLQVTDGSATRTGLVTAVAAVPQREAGRAGRGSGLSPADAAGRADIIARARAGNRARRAAAARARADRRARARAAARNALIVNRNAPHVNITPGPIVSAGQGDDVTLQATLTGAWGDGVTYAWRQTSGATAEITAGGTETALINAPDTQGPILLSVVATDTAGHTDTSQIELMVGAPPSTQGGQTLLAAFRAARASAPLPISLGNDITGTLRNLTGTRSGNTGSYAFTGSDITVGQVALQGVAGSLDATAITLTSGTLVLPAAWGITPIAITRSAPLVLQFATDVTRASLVGQARAPGAFALFALPDGWSGHSTLEFAPGSWRITALATGDDDGTATVRGSLWSDGTYEVAVDSANLVDVAGRRIGLSGVAGNHAGVIRNTVSGAIDTPINLGDGVSVQALSATWAPGASPKGTPRPIIRGAATLAIASGDAAPLTLSAALAYASPLDWRLTLTGRGSADWSPLPGLHIGADDVTGHIGDSDGVRQWAVTGRVGTWRASPLIAMSGMKLTLTDLCAEDAAPACPDAGLFLRLQGAVTLTTGATGAVSAGADAVLGLGDGGGFSLSAALRDLQLGPGIRVGAPALDVSYAMPRDLLPGALGRPGFAGDTNDGFGVRAIGSLALPSVGTYASVTASATDRGWTLGAHAPNGVALGAGNGQQQGAWFGWASYDTQMQAPVDGGDPISAPVSRNIVSVAGMYTAADWFTALVASRPAPAPSVIRLDPATGSVSGDVALAGDFTLPVGASRLTASGVVLGIRGGTAGIAVSARAKGDLQVRGADGATVGAPALDLALSGDAPMHTATGTLTPSGGGDWNDAFGVPGLTVRAPTMALSVDTTSRAATLRLMGGGVLPAGLSGGLRTPATGAPVVVAADLAAADSCVDVQVGDTTGTQPMVSLAGGALRARYYEFVIAPTGCRLSPTAPVLQPGLNLVFDAEVMGTTVDVAAPIALQPHLVLDHVVGIGPLLVGALRLGDASVKIHENGATGADEVGLSGNATIFNTPVRVAGAIASTGGDATGTLTGGAEAPIDVSGFPVRNLALQVAVRSGAAGGAATVAASGDITMMGDVVHVPSFTNVIDNGVVEDVRFSQQATVNIHGRATAAGLFTMHHRASNRTMTMAADVAFTTPGGITVGTAAAPAHLVIGPQCATLSGDTAIDGVATATVTGTIAHADGCTTTVRDASGAMITPATGDFGLFADHVMVTVDGVWNWGSVAIGNIGGTAYAKLATTLALSPQDTNARVPVAGTFTPGGDLLLTGAESVDAAGFTIPLTVTAKRLAGTTTITGAGTLDVAGNQVAITGTFTHDGGTPHTVFVGNVADLVLGGYHLGNAKLTLVDTATEKGFNADVVSKLGSDDGAHVIAEGHITLMHAPDGAVLYHGSLNGELSIPDLRQEMDGVVDITNCADECTKVVPTSYILNAHLSKWSYSFTFKVSFDAAGAFSARSETGRSNCSGEVDLFVFYARGCFDTKITMTIGNTTPYFSLQGSASVSAEIKAWYTGYDWEGFSISASARVQLDPFGVCVSMAGHDLCVP